MQTSTRSGSNETEATALAVSPKGVPSVPREVTIVTPVGRCPMTLRKWRCSGVNARPFEVGAWATSCGHPGLAFGLRDLMDEVAWTP